MTSELVPGGNLALPGGALVLRVAGPFDVSALVTDGGGKVGGDADFVFYNQPGAHGVRLHGGTLHLDPARLRPGATRVTVAVSAAEPGTPLGRLPAPRLEVTDGSGRALALFVPPRLGPETVLLLAELYQRGTGWKLRAIGQGYADGLAGLARDFGVDVEDDGPQTEPAPDADGLLGLVNSARARAGSPPVALDARLGSAARAHADAMAGAGRLTSEGLDGVSVHQRITATGYAYVTVGEHLVSGPRTPAEFVAYCLDTGQARHTLLGPGFTHLGLAHADAGDRYWTALWARPLTPGELSRTVAEVVALTNAERARAGLAPLAADPPLARAAQAHCADMVARDFYAHTCPDGSRPWDRAARAGSRQRAIGENIACGRRSPAEVVDGWMNSPGHRANILKADFTHIGVGFTGGGRAGTYWAQLFGG